jgi:hypothetical protein
MPGIKWTDPEIDLPFLTAKLPEFATVHSSSLSRKKNKDKKAFLNNVAKAYMEKFPKRYAEMEIPGAAIDASPDVREISFREVSVIRRYKSYYSPLSLPMVQTAYAPLLLCSGEIGFLSLT